MINIKFYLCVTSTTYMITVYFVLLKKHVTTPPLPFKDPWSHVHVTSRTLTVRRRIWPCCKIFVWIHRRRDVQSQVCSGHITY